MKAFVPVFALLAAASGESDPALLYSGLPLATTYGYGLPLAYAARPVAVTAKTGFPTDVHNTVAYTHVVAKREAEAEADPALVYAAAPYGYGYAGLPYYGFGVAPYTYPMKVAAPAAIPAVPGGYAAAGRYVANSGGIVHKAKREAEAEAEADPALLYAGAYAAPYAYGYAGLPYAYNYNPKVATPYGLTHPSNVGLCLNNVGLRVPC